jgi:hypothetical protein
LTVVLVKCVVDSPRIIIVRGNVVSQSNHALAVVITEVRDGEVVRVGLTVPVS